MRYAWGGMALPGRALRCSPFAVRLVTVGYVVSSLCGRWAVGAVGVVGDAHYTDSLERGGSTRGKRARVRGGMSKPANRHRTSDAMGHRSSFAVRGQERAACRCRRVVCYYYCYYYHVMKVHGAQVPDARSDLANFQDWPWRACLHWTCQGVLILVWARHNV